MPARKIEVAARELRRLVNKAVGRSFLKTITEPLTNSDSALKDKMGVAHAAGLVEALMNLKTGDRINTSILKNSIPKATTRKILVQLFPVKMPGREARRCRIVDPGPGMTCEELERNFAFYAEAKAKGRKTRSLFGRGALDVLLYHEDSMILSVKDGKLSSCRIYSHEKTKDFMCDPVEIGVVSKSVLAKHDVPDTLSGSGTVVEFRLREGTHIPQTEQVVEKLSQFYMLRLIASDPNTQVTVEQTRTGGRRVTETLSYDFPVGTVIGRFGAPLDLGASGTLPVDILVIRSDAALQTDPANIERRDNGLFFVDDNDAILDNTLLPEYDKNPYLQHIYGIVRIRGIREVLEAALDADDAVAVLSETRDGFNHRHDITRALFALVEKYVKPLYDAEERRQKKGDSTRSEKLAERVKNALKALNQFNSDETEETGEGLPPPPQQLPEPIFFTVKTVRLVVGIPKRVYVYVDLSRVNNEEIVLFESDNPEVKVEPDSETVKHRKTASCQRFDLKLTSASVGQTATISAITLNKSGQELRATLQVIGVDNPPVVQPPIHIEFSTSNYSGEPNRSNRASLLVNLAKFTGMPEITFWLEDVVGNISLGDEGLDRLKTKTAQEHIALELQLARVPVVFRGTGWGQKAILCAKAKMQDGDVALAKCRIRFERPAGSDKFTNFHYEDLRCERLGDVAGDKLYVNSGYALHKTIFGQTEDEFNKRLESDPIAQMRAASVMVEVVVYHAATVKHQAGGKKGLQIDPSDPIGSLRTYVESSRMKLEPRVIRALAPDVGQTPESGSR